MAAVAVTADNFRLDDAEALTGVASRGGGAGAAADPAFPYQGSNSWIRKVTSSTGAGFEYDPVADSKSAQDMTTAAKETWMVKCAVTDSGGLRSNDGVRIIVGDGTNEYVYIVAGSDAIKSAYSEYLLRQLYIIIPINVGVAGYRDSTHSSGTVTLTAVDIFGIDVEFATASAKSENVSLDALDLGTGLTLVGGDGVSTDGVWEDFRSQDEGTVGNRWGYASSLYQGATIILFGQMTIGSATATGFTDNSAQIIWPDGLFKAGFSNVTCDIQNSSTIIHDGSTHTSLGTTTTQDTRTDFTWTGTSGTGTANHVLNNFRNYVMTSAVTLDGANIQVADLTQSSGEIENSTIRCNSAANVAVCDDVTFGTTTGLHDSEFIQTGSGHAIEITSTGSHTLTNLKFTGFGGTAGSNLTSSSGATDAAVLNDTGGAVTLNISGGDTPSVRNGTGATTTVTNSVNITLSGLVAGSRVYIENTTDTTVLFNEIEATTTFTDSVNYTTDKSLLIRVRNASGTSKYKPFETTGTLTSSGFSLVVNQLLDE